MALKDSQHSLFSSFKYAYRGIVDPLKKERNLKIHFSATILVSILANVFNISSIEWMIVLLCIGMVVSMELMNYAIERVVDMFTEGEYHPLARKAKDSAAGAVLVLAVISLIIGGLIFWPYFIKIF